MSPGSTWEIKFPFGVKTKKALYAVPLPRPYALMPLLKMTIKDNLWTGQVFFFREYVLAVTLPPHTFFFLLELSTTHLFPSNSGFVWFEIIALFVLILVQMFHKFGLLNPPPPPWNFCLITLLGVSMNILWKQKEKRLLLSNVVDF